MKKIYCGKTSIVELRCHSDPCTSQDKQHMATMPDPTDDECWQITSYPTVEEYGNLLKMRISATVEIKDSIGQICNQ